jgi:hypothetical protein
MELDVGTKLQSGAEVALELVGDTDLNRSR